jgi:hypothetical protein
VGVAVFYRVEGLIDSDKPTRLVRP